MLKGILFDLDGTLLDRDASVRELVVAQHQRFSNALMTISSEVYVARVIELDCHGYGNKTALYEQIAMDFGLPRSLAATLTADFWNNYHSHCRSFADVLPALAELHERGVKLGVITNGSVRTQEPVIACLGLRPLLDTVLISEREGVRKPDREIFNRALRRLDLSADEAWYVGDHPESDVEGAAAAGLMAVWRRTPYWPEPHVPHRKIENLNELFALFERNR